MTNNDVENLKNFYHHNCPKISSQNVISANCCQFKEGKGIFSFPYTYLPSEWSDRIFNYIICHAYLGKSRAPWPTLDALPERNYQAHGYQ